VDLLVAWAAGVLGGAALFALVWLIANYGGKRRWPL
jgi:hypothetical protein